MCRRSKHDAPDFPVMGKQFRHTLLFFFENVWNVKIFPWQTLSDGLFLFLWHFSTPEAK